MASTSRASRKIVEDAETFQVFEESTDSDVTIYSSEDDEDGNEPDSGEDGQLDDNSETNEDGGTRTSGPITPRLKWTNTLHLKELEKYKYLSGPKYSLSVGSSEKDFLSYLCPMVLQHEEVTAVVWQDKRVVLFLSTNTDHLTDGSVTRKQEKAVKKLKLQVLKPS
jgi:hypothetical protein